MCIPTVAEDGEKIPDETPVPLHVPPNGEAPERIKSKELTQTGLNSEILTDGAGYIVICLEVSAVQPLLFVTEYVIVFEPTVVWEGYMYPLITPSPLYVPPDGNPPNNST